MLWSLCAHECQSGLLLDPFARAGSGHELWHAATPRLTSEIRLARDQFTLVFLSSPSSFSVSKKFHRRSTNTDSFETLGLAVYHSDTRSEHQNSATRKLKPPTERQTGTTPSLTKLTKRRRFARASTTRASWTTSLLLRPPGLGNATGRKLAQELGECFPVPLDRRQRVSPAYQSKCAST